MSNSIIGQFKEQWSLPYHYQVMPKVLTDLTVFFGEYFLSETMHHASQTGPCIQLNTVIANLAINN